LFTTLNQNGSSGISENQLASDVAQGQKAHHHHHHHPSAEAPPSSSGDTSSTDLASQASRIFGGLDSNQDGTLSAAELTSAGLGAADPALSAASNGTASSNTPNSLASLDSNGDGSVSANEFATFFASLELQIQSDTATMANLLQASQAYGSAAGGSSPPSVVQSA
jgi:Ca2+-binding EF-hand superfamily protein